MEDLDPTRPAPLPAWRTCLDFRSQDAGHYNDLVFEPLLELLAEPPRRVLELGCAGGALGAELKARHPGATVVGVDAGEAAAQRAESRLDRVVCASLDDLDLAAAGFRQGEFDTVIAADVLEHLVNPWGLLDRLRTFLAPRAQVLTSIPNVRNLTVTANLLLGGRFEYEERGLLDVTHLRFFTLESMRRMFQETGYVVDEIRSLLLPALEKLYSSYAEKSRGVLRLGRLTIENVTPQELTELCAAQFLLRCRPA